MTQKQDSIPAELLDQLLANCKNPKDFLGENGFIKQLMKAFVERALQAELSGVSIVLCDMNILYFILPCFWGIWINKKAKQSCFG
jgi:hypothetical protein